MPAWVSRLLAREVVEVATIKFVTGLVSFPFFYALQTWLVRHWMGSWIALAYFLLLPVTGLFALFYAEDLAGFTEEIRVFLLHLLRGDRMDRLQKRRDRIIRELERGRDEYLSGGLE
jgi:hypothetical protein